MKRTDLVDVFLGSGAVELPELKGIAAKWSLIKGMAGNTSPGAVRPFGKFSACAYSGGYSSGYGHLGINCCGPVPEILPHGAISGFSHVQSSGTGYTGTFYNYAVTAPFFGDVENAFAQDIMTRETARPGYYAADMHGVLVELTMSDKAAHHRYTFPKEGGRIAIDFTHDGLHEEKTTQPHEDLRIDLKDGLACVSVTLHGLRLYFAVRCEESTPERWEKGVIFNVCGTSARLALGLSPRSMEFAVAGADEVKTDFDAIRSEADALWEKALSAIDIEARDDRDTRLFFSNFYHTLVKPCDYSGESFLYDDEDDFMLDFATLWDQYKTQFPLLYTLYPEIARKISRTVIAFCRSQGRMPHKIYLDRSNAAQEDNQAKMLAEFTLYDAALRQADFDIAAAVAEIKRDVLPDHRFADYKKCGVCDDIAHTMDLADGFYAAARLADRAGDSEFAAYCDAMSGRWTNAYDKKSGLLNPESRFYEGNHWNYSFRLTHDMDTRLAIAGGEERYASLLDVFFGFTPETAPFEGFNNETDMETPYAYHYAHRQDRLCEVVRAGLDYMFSEGRGGLPGNNDSGGLSSLYMWNMSGIFPVSGQNVMLIGSPRLKKTVFHLANGRDFTVIASGSGIYTRKAVLNGRELPDFAFSVTDMMAGGELLLEMSGTPS